MSEAKLYSFDEARARKRNVVLGGATITKLVAPHQETMEENAQLNDSELIAEAYKMDNAINAFIELKVFLREHNNIDEYELELSDLGRKIDAHLELLGEEDIALAQEIANRVLASSNNTGLIE